MVTTDTGADPTVQAASYFGRLQALVAGIGSARSVRSVTGVVVDSVLTALAADAGAVLLLGADGATTEWAAVRGYTEFDRAMWSTIPLDTPLPLFDALRLRQPVWLDASAVASERYDRFIAMHRVAG